MRAAPWKDPVTDLTRLAARVRRSLPAWVTTIGVDALLTVAVMALTSYRIMVEASVPTERPADAPDVMLVLGMAWVMAAGLVARRRWPRLVLLWVWFWWTAYQVVAAPDEPPSLFGGAPQPAVWVALYTAAAAERRRGLFLIAVLMVLGDWSGRGDEPGAAPFSTVLDSSTVIWIGALLLGDAVRSRRRLRAETRARLAQERAEREREAERRVADERLRIARELHDVTAHTVSVIAVHSGVAAEMLDDDPQRARDALGVIRTASGEALDEMKATVGMLREPGAAAPAEAALAPTPTLDQVGDLLRTAEAGGVEATLTVTGTPRRLPPAVDLTAYRIVQESVTNVLRHAHARHLTVTLDHTDGGLRLTVADDGSTGRRLRGPDEEGGRSTGPNGEVPSGYGLAGMRERAAALGGSVQAGAGPEGGFTVRAWLPAAADGRQA